MSFFESVTQLPEDAILQLPILFAADPRPNKVNLGIGTYKDAMGAPMVFTCVESAEKALLSEKQSKEYLPIEGDSSFLKASTQLVFGVPFLSSYEGGLFAAQALGGTGALRLGGEFLVQETSRTIFLPTPTWPNHKPIFTRSGMKIHAYRYYDEINHRLDFSGMCSDISQMPPGSTILFHSTCHNPTGIDPSFEQWKELSHLIKSQRIIPFFDFAYQGFVDTVETDAQTVRYFASQGHEMLVANSFSKNLGLYGERVGSLSVLTINKETARRVGSQIKQIIRGNYSNPPRHGAQVAAKVMLTENLREEWLKELANVRDRIKEMRRALIAGLDAKTGKDWSYLNRQNGFFSFCGLEQKQVHRLIQDYAIYMPANGRINIAGLNGHNLSYVVEAIADVKSS